MPDYCVTISTKVNVTTYVTAADEDAAADAGWVLAQEYARTVVGDHAVVAEADFDGVGADEVYEVDQGGADVFQRTRRILSRPHVPVV